MQCCQAAQPNSEMENAVYQLENYSDEATIKIVDYLTSKAKSKACINKPLFLTMANVGSELYWKLIENFYYTMRHFGHEECAILICISGKIMICMVLIMCVIML